MEPWLRNKNLMILYRRCPFPPPRRYRSLSPTQVIDWNSRVISNVHAIFVGAVCLHELLFDDGVRRSPIWCESCLVRINCAIVIGYVALRSSLHCPPLSSPSRLNESNPQFSSATWWRIWQFYFSIGPSSGSFSSLPTIAPPFMPIIM